MVAGPGDEIAAGTGGRGHLRASRADREQVIGTLKAAFVQGRLVKDEFDLRVGQALAPRTYAELAALTADLPAGLYVGMSRAPGPVRNAVRLMCAGAVLTLASVVIVLVTLGGVRWAAANDLGARQWPTVMLTQAGFWLASAPIGAGVWLWLAWANGRGYHWARPAFVAFFCVLTMVPFFGLGRGRLAVYPGRRDRRGGALAGRAGGDGAHLQRDGQRVLPAPGSNASSNTGEQNRTVAGALPSAPRSDPAPV